MEAIAIEINIETNNEKYKIKDRTLSRNENIYCRNFIIIFMDEEIVKISVGYSENNPVSATLYFIQDSSDIDFVNIIQLLLANIYNEIPTLSEVAFEDQSNIEFPLYYFSIAFNPLLDKIIHIYGGPSRATLYMVLFSSKRVPTFIGKWVISPIFQVKS